MADSITLQMSVDLTGLDRKFGALVAAASDPKKALLRIGGYVRSEAEKRFQQQGPGWDALSEETTERKATAIARANLASKGDRRSDLDEIARRQKQVVRSLLAASKRPDSAVARRHLGHAADARMIVNRLITKHALALGNVRGANTAMQAAMILAEREKKRRALHRQQTAKARAMPLAEGESYGLRRWTSFDAPAGTSAADRYKYPSRERTARYVRDASPERRREAARGRMRYRAGSNPGILGDLDKSLTMVLEGRTVRIFSHARIGQIHNVGGTAGHGAKIPARPFMYLPTDWQKIAREIVEEEMAGAWMWAE